MLILRIKARSKETPGSLIRDLRDDELKEYGLKDTSVEGKALAPSTSFRQRFLAGIQVLISHKRLFYIL